MITSIYSVVPFIVACTTGHYYDTKSSACHKCGYGLYQDEYSQVSCKSCDTGQSTKHKGSPSKSDCEGKLENTSQFKHFHLESYRSKMLTIKVQ